MSGADWCCIRHLSANSHANGLREWGDRSRSGTMIREVRLSEGKGRIKIDLGVAEVARVVAEMPGIIANGMDAATRYNYTDKSPAGL